MNLYSAWALPVLVYFQAVTLNSRPQSTFSFCLDDDVAENVTVTTTPPELEIEALWTMALLSPIVFMDTEVGSSSVDAVWSEESLRGQEVSFINTK